MVFGSGLLTSGFRVAAQPVQDKTSLIVAAGLDEPTRRLREEPHNAEKDKERDDLEGNGEAPPECGSASVDKIQAELQPVGNYNTEDVECELDCDELTPGRMLCSFRCPDRDDSVENAGSNSIDETSYEDIN